MSIRFQESCGWEDLQRLTSGRLHNTAILPPLKDAAEMDDPVKAPLPLSYHRQKFYHQPYQLEATL